MSLLIRPARIIDGQGGVLEGHGALIDGQRIARVAPLAEFDAFSGEVLRLDDGTLITIDVRPETEYAAGHIRGARSVPIDQLSEIVRGLPADVEVVLSEAQAELQSLLEALQG